MQTTAADGERLGEARRYTAQVARHYENFTVVSWLLPRAMRQHFYNVYAFCRHADDLADEIADKDRSLAELSRLRNGVKGMYAGEPCPLTAGDSATDGIRSTGLQIAPAGNPLPTSPKGEEKKVLGWPSSEVVDASALILLALCDTVRQFDIPPEPFLALIDAFEQDQHVSRYETFEQLRNYCQRSADPVGRLVLYMAGYRDAERQALSDCTCTALQLTNFWQDVASDLERGRIYIPREDIARFGVLEQDIVARRSTPQFIEMMKFEVARARDMFAEGRKLLPMVHRRVRGDIALYGLGGVAILDRIAAVGYNVLERRPTLSKAAKLGLMARYLIGV